MVRYSTRATRALAFLNSPFNDIEIYVEDLACHNMFLQVFRAILGPTHKLRSVNQVGNKKAVIDLCRGDQTDTTRKRIYIVDGDLDILLGWNKPRLKHLYRLNSYCIENILITEAAIVALCMNSDPGQTEQDIKSSLNFDTWTTSVTSSLRGLFVVYAIAHELSVHFDTTSYKVERLCKKTGKTRTLEGALISQRIREVVKSIIAEHGFQSYIETSRQVRNKIRSRNWPAFQHLSGKTYLLPLLQNRLMVEYKFKGDASQLKAHLASHFDVKAEPYLAKRLRGIAKA